MLVECLELRRKWLFKAVLQPEQRRVRGSTAEQQQQQQQQQEQSSSSSSSSREKLQWAS
jgi:hypothetical protein